jgi:capsular polysaccharide biosynthesis protein
VLTWRPRSSEELGRILWRRKVSFALVSGVVFVSSVIAIAALPNLYESRALIAVADGGLNREEAGTWVGIVTTRMRSRSTLEQLALAHPDTRNASDPKALEDELQKAVNIETRMRGTTNIPESLTVAVRRTSPDVAQHTAADLVALVAAANEEVAQAVAAKGSKPVSVGKGNPLFQVLDAPNLPTAPVGPDRGRLYVTAVVLALVLATLTALALELPRLRSIRDERDVDFYLGVPTLGTLLRVELPEERGRRRARAVALGLGLALAAAVFVPLLGMALQWFRIFEFLSGG